MYVWFVCHCVYANAESNAEIMPRADILFGVNSSFCAVFAWVSSSFWIFCLSFVSILCAAGRLTLIFAADVFSVAVQLFGLFCICFSSEFLVQKLCRFWRFPCLFGCKTSQYGAIPPRNFGF